MEIQAALDVADETDAFLQITDVIFDRVEEAGYSSLTQAEKTVYCVDSLSREMENGGFALFFYHEIGAFCSDVQLALESIRAKNSLEIFNKVMSYFPNSLVPVDEAERVEAFDQVTNNWFDEMAECDDRFLEVGENLIELTLKFVSKNLSEFR